MCSRAGVHSSGRSSELGDMLGSSRDGQRGWSQGRGLLPEEKVIPRRWGFALDKMIREAQSSLGDRGPSPEERISPWRVGPCYQGMVSAQGQVVQRGDKQPQGKSFPNFCFHCCPLSIPGPTAMGHLPLEQQPHGVRGGVREDIFHPVLLVPADPEHLPLT